MGKSNYPNKLDTSIEIPAVRDNIVEVGSDVLNSLRSAIFNIERTLGINPQGATGNTVASRVNRALDGNGNILKDALDKAGLLSGPITDVDVSKVAGIDESKLKLKYPTTLLQDEISQIIKQIELISATLEELAFLYAAHTHPEAKDRHKGHAITIDAIDRAESDIGLVSSERQNAQELFEGVFSSHINYSGADISEGNRSHEAKQLFFDKSDVSAYIYSEDVQGAIIDVLNTTRGQVEGHQNRHHSNGVLRTSVIAGAEDRTAGRMLIDEQEVTYAKYSSAQTHRLSSITFSSPPPIPERPIERSDILRIYSGIDESIVDYQVHSVNYSGATVASILIFGALDRNSDPLDRVKVFKNINAATNPAGLLVSARPFPGATNVSIVQVANPNSSTIVSKGIRPSEISVNNRHMTVTIDRETEVTVDVWDGAAVAGQSIDSIVKAMNIEFAEKGASVLAYRVDYDDLHSPEVALVHSLPSSSSQSFSLSVSKYQSDKGIYSLGFGYIEDEVIDQGSGSEYYIQGVAYSGLGVKLEQTGLDLLEGSSAITSLAAGVDFGEYGVAKGDLVVVTNTASDDGTYVIEQVSPTSITVDEDQLTGGGWSGESSGDSVFYILKSTLSLKEFEFSSPGCHGGSAATVVDIFLDKSGGVFRNVRLEYAIKTHLGGVSLLSPCEFDGDISVYSEASPGVIDATLTGGGIPQLSLDGGPSVEMPELKSGYVRLKSGAYNITLLVFIEDSDLIKAKIVADAAPFSLALYGSVDINLEENLLLARVHYDSQFSRVTGAGAYLSRIFKKFEEGVTSDKDLSSKALKRVYQGPISETRSNGVVEGLKLTPAAVPRLAAHPQEYVVDIAGGACYVKGKKFIFEGYTDLISDVASDPIVGYDKVFIAINEWGEIVFAGASSSGGSGSCICPFSADSHCILSVIEWDGLNPPVAIDLRLFLNDLDLTVLNAVTVSPQKGMGHFTEFGEALKYTKRFGDMFPKAGTPTIHLKSGTHKVVVNTGVPSYSPFGGRDPVAWQAASYYGSWINFPVNIVGEGYSTVLDILKIHSDVGEEGDDRSVKGQNSDHAGWLYIAGPDLKPKSSGGSKPDGNGDLLTNGFVTLKDFRMKLCGINVIDNVIKDDDGNKLTYGINIDNVIFDWSEYTASQLHNTSLWMLHSGDSGQSPPIKWAGNLSVTNCQFLNSYIEFKHYTCDLQTNINISNNSFRGNGSDEDGETHWAIMGPPSSGGGAGSLYDLVDTGFWNNVEIRGNTLSDNSHDYTNGGYTFAAGDRWGDRISRDLVVGGKVGIGNNPASGIDEPGSGYFRLRVAGGTAVAPSSGNAAWLEGGTWIDGELTIGESNDITVEDGDVNVEGNGNINVAAGNVNVNGTGYLGGKVNALHLNLTGIPGDDVPVITMKSISTTDYAASTILLERGTSCSNNTRLGELWFRGMDSSQVMKYGSGIIGCAAETWDSSSWRSDLRFFVNHSNASWGTERMRLSPDGILRLNGGSDIDLSGSSGVLQIGEPLNLETGSGQHIAIDKNEIQSKDGATTASYLYLNASGGEVCFGEAADRLGILGSEIRSISGDTVRINDRLTVEGFATIGSSVTSGSRAAKFIGNSGNPNESTPGMNLFNPLVHIQDHQSDSMDGCALWIQLPNVEEAAMDDGDPKTEGAEFFVVFSGEDGSVGFIANQGGSMVYGGFTGSHITPVDKDELHDLKTIGLIVSSNGIAMTDKAFSEPYVGTTLSRKEKDKSVLGVICERPRLYDDGLVLSNWKKGVHGITVNSLGNGRIWVTNIAGNIENGDFICSSNIPGYGQMQDDDLMHNYTAAKSTEAIDWDNVTDTITHNGIEYKKFLVACSYHCG